MTQRDHFLPQQRLRSVDEEDWEPLPDERVVYLRDAHRQQAAASGDQQLLDALLEEEEAQGQPDARRRGAGAVGPRHERLDRGRAQRTTRRQPAMHGLESRLRTGLDYGLEILAHTAGAAVGMITWWIGGYFTLLALRDFGVPIALNAWHWWLIPVGVSAIEICWWPLRMVKERFQLRRGGYGARMALHGGRKRTIGIAIFTIFALFDILSTFYGFKVWFAGRFFPVGMGWTAPTEGLGLMIPSIAVALIFTFAPERILAWAARELFSLTISPVWRRIAG